MDQGRLVEAEPYLREALQMSRRAQGERGSKTELAIGELGALLVAQHKYTDAEKLLAPFEAESRSAGTAYYRYAHPMILMNLWQGSAPCSASSPPRKPTCSKRKPPSRPNSCNFDAPRKYTRAVVDLYNAWNVAEPGKGYGIKAAEWKRKLDAADARPPAAAAR